MAEALSLHIIIREANAAAGLSPGEVTMAIQDLFKSGVARGIVIGAAAAVLLPVAAQAARPLMRAAIKGGIRAWEKGREAAAELQEMVDDVTAEVQEELAAEARAAEAEAAEAAAEPGPSDPGSPPSSDPRG
jgi:hypothetical protein